MKALTIEDFMRAYARTNKKFCIYVRFPEWTPDCKWAFEEIFDAFPLKCSTQILFEECGFLVFNTRKEMQEAFESIVGDDGPTKRNSYNGHCRVYALTCNSRGQLETSNT